MRLILRVSTLCRALLHYVVAGIEVQNPEALLELERENLRRLMGQYNLGLASQAGLAERLMSQTRALENEQTALQTRIAANIRQGNRGEAGKAALRLKEVRGDFAACREQLAQTEKTYESLRQARELAVGAAKAKIESVRRAIGELRTQRAVAELSSLAAGLTTGSAAGGETLERLREMVDEQRSHAVGRARVARDALGLDDLQARESEQAASAEQALADFLAQSTDLATADQGLMPAERPVRSRALIRGPGERANKTVIPIDAGGSNE